MKLTAPAYYEEFRCLAGACPDSCCHEWAVQVDAQTAAAYRALPGPLGDDLRRALVEEDGETVLALRDGRCAMWREDGLCRIQAALGEQALCPVCREFPRLRHDYGDFVELGLELSCPEAARLILADAGDVYSREVPGGEAPEYDAREMAVLKATRETALKLLHGEPGPALAALLLFGYDAQSWLDGETETAAAPDGIPRPEGRGDHKALAAFYQQLEILTPRWRDLLRRAEAPRLTQPHLALARYLVNRYWLQTIADGDLLCRVKWIVSSCLLVSMLPGAVQDVAQLYSKELENDIDNVDAILDAAYTHPALTDQNLLTLCLP